MRRSRTFFVGALLVGACATPVDPDHAATSEALAAPPLAQRIDIADPGAPAFPAGLLAAAPPACLGKLLKWESFAATMTVGDFDGDGFDDLAVGSIRDHRRTLGGAVYVFRGDASGVLVPWFVLDRPPGAEDRFEEFGQSMTSGDFDGDGKDDLVVGAPDTPVGGVESGWVFTFRGGAQGLTPWGGFGLPAGLDPTSAGFGGWFAAGDLDGDGKDELAVSSARQVVSGLSAAGGVSLFRGTAQGLIFGYALQHQALGPPQANEGFGAPLAMGDWNGDGRADLAVGATGANGSRGAVYTFLAPPPGSPSGALPVLVASQRIVQPVLPGAPLPSPTRERFGTGLAAGDFDGDGKDDLAVGAPGAAVAGNPSGNFDTGAVFALHQTAAGFVPWTSFTWTTAGHGNSFGYSLAADDLDGDGKDDLVAARYTNGPFQIFAGSSAGPVPWFTPGGDYNAAATVAPVIGDFNGDGRKDLAHSEFLYESSFPPAGSTAQVYLGKPGTPPLSQEAVPALWGALDQQAEGCTPTWPTAPTMELLGVTNHQARLKLSATSPTARFEYWRVDSDDHKRPTASDGTFTLTDLIPGESTCLQGLRFTSASQDPSDPSPTFCFQTTTSTPTPPTITLQSSTPTSMTLLFAGGPGTTSMEFESGYPASIPGGTIAGAQATRTFPGLVAGTVLCVRARRYTAPNGDSSDFSSWKCWDIPLVPPTLDLGSAGEDRLTIKFSGGPTPAASMKVTFEATGTGIPATGTFNGVPTFSNVFAGLHWGQVYCMRAKWSPLAAPHLVSELSPWYCFRTNQ